MFAKPLSCLHFGHIFVNAAWPLWYQRLTHDSQPTIAEQERQQIKSGFGGQILQIVQEKLSYVAFNSLIAICRLDKFFRFLFLTVFLIIRDMVMTIFFFFNFKTLLKILEISSMCPKYFPRYNFPIWCSYKSNEDRKI